MLNDAGVKYLCEYLGLPEDVVPATYKKIKVARDNEDGDKKVDDLDEGKKKVEDEAPVEVRA